MTIKLYMDYISQPSRAVRSLLLLTNTPHQIVQTRISKHQNMTQNFLSLNPLSTVPFIQDTTNELRLAQSHSIMRYICQKQFPNILSWYPLNDYSKMAKIDQYCDFHLGNTRKCHHYIFNAVFAKKIKLNNDKQFIQQEARKNVDKNLSLIQRYFFKEGRHSYLTGDLPTIADLSGYYQIQFLFLCNQDFYRWPIIRNWLKKMSQIKQVQESNKTFFKLFPRMAQNPKIQII